MTATRATTTPVAAALAAALVVIMAQTIYRRADRRELAPPRLFPVGSTRRTLAFLDATGLWRRLPKSRNPAQTVRLHTSSYLENHARSCTLSPGMTAASGCEQGSA